MSGLLSYAYSKVTELSTETVNTQPPSVSDNCCICLFHDSHSSRTVGGYVESRRKWSGAVDVIVWKGKDTEKSGTDDDSKSEDTSTTSDMIYRSTGFHIKLFDAAFRKQCSEDSMIVISAEVNDCRISTDQFCLYQWSDDFGYFVKEEKSGASDAAAAASTAPDSTVPPTAADDDPTVSPVQMTHEKSSSADDIAEGASIPMRKRDYIYSAFEWMSPSLSAKSTSSIGSTGSSLTVSEVGSPAAVTSSMPGTLSSSVSSSELDAVSKQVVKEFLTDWWVLSEEESAEDPAVELLKVRNRMRGMQGIQLELQKWKLRIPTQKMIESLKLRPGRNHCVFRLQDLNDDSAEPSEKMVECSIFLFDNNNNDGDSSEKTVVSDIDGTISKSDIPGHIAHHFGYDWTHKSTVKFFNLMSEHQNNVVYMTARSVGMAKRTRKWLFHMVSDEGDDIAVDHDASDEQSRDELPSLPQLLPEGPVLLAPTTTTDAFYREVWHRIPHEVKIPFLRHTCYVLGRAFSAGFGNRLTDAMAYRGCGVPDSHIFIVSPGLKKKINRAKLALKEQGITDVSDRIFHKRTGMTFGDCDGLKIVDDYQEILDDPSMLALFT